MTMLSDVASSVELCTDTSLIDETMAKLRLYVKQYGDYIQGINNPRSEFIVKAKKFYPSYLPDVKLCADQYILLVYQEIIFRLDGVHKELCECSDIALRLDSLNPELPSAFIGTPSERIRRQLAQTHNIWIVAPKEQETVQEGIVDMSSGTLSKLSRMDDYSDDYPGYDPIDDDSTDWRDI